MRRVRTNIDIILRGPQQEHGTIGPPARLQVHRLPQICLAYSLAHLSMPYACQEDACIALPFLQLKRITSSIGRAKLLSTDRMPCN